MNKKHKVTGITDEQKNYNCSEVRYTKSKGIRKTLEESEFKQSKW